MGIEEGWSYSEGRVSLFGFRVMFLIKAAITTIAVLTSSPT